MRSPGGTAPSRPSGIRAREGDRRRRSRAICQNAAQASSTVSAKTETQSSVRQAGTTPASDTAPSVGFSPTMLFRPAGTRPEPAVSVPSANGTIPARDRDGRAGAGAAGHEVGAKRVARHAVGRAHADEPGGELVEIGLADDERAGRPQTRHRPYASALGV